jgi:hypothetical protein
MTNDLRSRRTARISIAIVVAASVAAPASAFAWNFEEHKELGTSGYQSACDQLAHDLKLDLQPKAVGADAPKSDSDACVTASDPRTVRWCIACRTFSAQRYGDAVAIAGDHVGSPEELMSPAGQTVAASVVDYTFLALVNWQHFHPAAPQNWRRYHGEAVEKAVRLANEQGPDGRTVRDFEQVFYTSAFADHFLQDSFSAGHSGFNRPSTGAVAAKAFHDIWNRSGRLVKSPTGDCWLQFGDGKLKPPTDEGGRPDVGRRQIDTAEIASVRDVLETFVTGARDPAREVRPVYYMPSEITPNPLPKHVWGTRGTESPTRAPPAVLDDLSRQQMAGLVAVPHAGKHHQLVCRPNLETVPIDGTSNPALINGGIDFYAVAAGLGGVTYGSIDVLYNHRLWSFMSLPFSWEGGLGMGYLRRDARNSWAPSATFGMLAPPLYLVHGLWRNELGGQVKGYVVTNGPDQADGYASPFIRTSLEVATVIVRLQAGPTWDFRTGRAGFVGGLGLEFAGLRWITGGGSLTDF